VSTGEIENSNLSLTCRPITQTETLRPSSKSVRLKTKQARGSGSIVINL
jgi:hypothetical protein